MHLRENIHKMHNVKINQRSKYARDTKYAEYAKHARYAKYHASPHVQGLLTKVNACLCVANAYLGRK